MSILNDYGSIDTIFQDFAIIYVQDNFMANNFWVPMIRYTPMYEI